MLYEHQFLSETRLSGPCVCAGTSTHECALQTLGFQFISSLFPERAPAGQELLLAYYGGAQNSPVKDLAQVKLFEHSRLPLSLSPSSTPPPYAIQQIFWEILPA